jgi:S-adenosylmethionine decarboxylase
MKGLHLTADLYRCRCEPAWLTDPQQLATWCLAAAEAVGLHAAQHLFHAFPSGGGAATLLLPEGHVCLHTWPGDKAVSADVLVADLDGDQSAKARGLMFALVNRFQPEWTEQRSLDRGDEE